MIRTLSALLRGIWLIEKQFAENNIPIVASLINGNKVVFSGNKKDTTNPYFTSEAEWDERGHKPLVAFSPTSGSTVRASRYRSFDEAPEGSLALIPVTGPILKYGGECGEPGSIHMTDWIKQANISSKIAGIICRIDSPGGMVDGTATFADAIKNSTKPTIGFVDDGMMASAAMWIGSACDELYASQKTDTIGSIGVYTTLYDFSERLKMLGVNIHEIYAPQSSEKNKSYMDALKGNDKSIKEELRFICDQFISTIKTNRAGKLNLSAGDPFKGDMYFAEQAMEIGLIDGIKSFDQVVSYLMGMAASGSKKQNTGTSKSTHMFGSNFKKVAALKGKKAEEISAEEITAANAELASEGITGLVLGIDQASVISQLNNELSAANKAKGDLEVQLADSVKKAVDTEASLNKQVTDLQAEVARLGKQAGDKPTDPPKGKEEITGDDKTAENFAGYDHNKKALEDISNL